MSNENWFKSSYSDSEGANCVEVALSSGTVRVRDSKDQDGPALAITPTAWAAFVGQMAKEL